MTDKHEMDIRTAIFLAAVCEQTYNLFRNDGLFLVPRSYRLIGTFNAASSYSINQERFGFVIESDQAVILAFRGTSTPTDWVTDMIAQQVLFKPVKRGCKTHRGFSEVYMSARDQIFHLLDQTSKDKPLFITGHSLGGALAAHAALDIAINRKPKNLITYTFGAPRAGDPEFARSYNDAVPLTFRIQNEFDIVPHLPPLVYTLPKSKKTYYYMHVKEGVMRKFHNGSISGNHVIGSYFANLAKDAPEFAAMFCDGQPGMCPLP